MPAKAKTVTEYLAALTKERRDAIQAVRKVIKANLDKGYREGIQYGGIGYYLPHSVYPAGYHCDPKQPLPFAGIMAQKHHIGIYLFCVYSTEGEPERFRKEWLATGKKLDMGKSCIRFKKIEDVPLEVVGRAVKRATVKKFIAAYESAFVNDATRRRKKSTTTKKTTKAGPRKKIATKKKTAKKKTTRKKATTKKTATRKKATRAKAPARKKPATKKAPSRATARTTARKKPARKRTRA